MPDDLSDARLEAEIRLALDACLLETDQRAYRELWAHFVGLMALRSSRQVARMERERGLR
jgi:hypothetical protein